MFPNIDLVGCKCAAGLGIIFLYSIIDVFEEHAFSFKNLLIVFLTFLITVLPIVMTDSSGYLFNSVISMPFLSLTVLQILIIFFLI